MSGYRFWWIDHNSVEYWLVDGVHAYLKPNGMKGFGVLAIDPAAARRPYRAGVTITGDHYTGPRTMDIAALMTGDTHGELAAYVRALARNVSPHKDPSTLGKLKVVTPDDQTWHIDCWLSEMSDPQWDGPVACDVLFTLWAPEPWFYDPTKRSETIGLANPGGVTYPADYVDPTGLEYADSYLDDHVSVSNDGDVETWPTIRINGPGEDPTIENETSSKTMAITQTLDDGDYIDIDMDNATITFYDFSGGTTTNIIANMSAASVFYPLARGENVLHVTMTSVTTGSIVVEWYNKYQAGW